jgi:ABC-2 type transport system permease protein
VKPLSIAVKDIRIIIRDRRAILVLLAMPFVIITILGLALGGMWSGNSGVSRFDIAVVDHDKGEISKEFHDLLTSKDMKSLFNVQTLEEAEARRLVSNGDLAAAVIIPKNFSKRITLGEDTIMQVLADPGQQVRSGIVRSITDSFAAHVSSIIIATKTPVSILAADGTVPPVQVGVLAKEIAAQARQALNNPQITVRQDGTARNKDITAIQYYSAAMSVMFILFGAMLGAFSLLDERRNMTLVRLMSSPTSRASILSGKLWGVFLIGILQFTVLVIATRLIFGVKWGNSPLGLVALMVCTVLAATGMTIFIAAIAKTNKSAAAISQIMIQSMAALGGSMMPLQVFPPWMQSISRFTINYWGITGFRNLMLGQGFSAVVTPCIIFLGISVFFMTVGLWRFRYE